MDQTRLYRKSTEKVCPACGSIYDLYKTFCPLAHCPTCGGLACMQSDHLKLFQLPINLVPQRLQNLACGLFIAPQFLHLKGKL